MAAKGNASRNNLTKRIKAFEDRWGSGTREGRRDDGYTFHRPGSQKK